jgi:general secretion pathway protein D
MNLFDLDRMRRQQMAPPAVSAPAPVTNGGAVTTNPVMNNGGAVYQTNPATNGPAVQTNPVQVAPPSTASPGAQP